MREIGGWEKYKRENSRSVHYIINIGSLNWTIEIHMMVLIGRIKYMGECLHYLQWKIVNTFRLLNKWVVVDWTS